MGRAVEPGDGIWQEQEWFEQSQLLELFQQPRSALPQGMARVLSAEAEIPLPFEAVNTLAERVGKVATGFPKKFREKSRARADEVEYRMWSGSPRNEKIRREAALGEQRTQLKSLSEVCRLILQENLELLAEKEFEERCAACLVYLVKK